jgi:hypothetical protein
VQGLARVKARRVAAEKLRSYQLRFGFPGPQRGIDNQHRGLGRDRTLVSRPQVDEQNHGQIGVVQLREREEARGRGRWVDVHVFGWAEQPADRALAVKAIWALGDTRVTLQ